MLLSEMVLLTDFFILFLTVLSVKIPMANWVAVVLSLLCLIPMPEITGTPFLLELTVGTVTISVIVTLFNVWKRLQQ